MLGGMKDIFFAPSDAARNVPTLFIITILSILFVGTQRAASAFSLPKLLCAFRYMKDKKSESLFRKDM